VRASAGITVQGKNDELHDMSEAECEAALTLRPATPEDRFRIRRWLAEPEIAAWWGNAASAEAEINLAMSSEAALCRIIARGVEPVGYAHAVEIGLWGEARPEDVAPGTWDINLFIAPGEHRGRGLGAAALSLLTEEVFATTLAVACCGLVSIRNEGAVRAYERAGFRWRRIWHEPLLGPSWLMLRERPDRPPQDR
jgi:aminoglycoside 6'-N-acetyltransferase